MITRFVIFSLCLIQFVFAQNNSKIFPPNGKVQDLELRLFLAELEVAVLKKDKAFIINHLSENIKNGFGGDHGVKGFLEYWDWENGGSNFWSITAEVLSLGGGAYEGDGLYMLPYVFSEWPAGGDYDEFEHGLILGTRVNVRDKPDLTSSKVVGQCSYDIVKVDYEKCFAPVKQNGEKDYESDFEWYYIADVDSGLKGYVYWKYFRSPLGYRFVFIKENGKWVISAIVAGD